MKQDERARAGLPAWVVGKVETPAGAVPVVSTVLSWRDGLGTVAARWGVGRMDYRVEPGIYAVGSPDPEAPVAVTANCKLTFDKVRVALHGRSAWILVLDTMGINVWCAAGKGTFGTEELVRRIEAVGLSRIVSHRRVVLPQLGAPGVAAHLVRGRSGFNAVYGPVRVEDLPAYLDAGGEAGPGMRRKTFDLAERAVLIPVELVEAVKYGLPIAAVLFLVAGLGWQGGYAESLLLHGPQAASIVATAILAGAVLTPLLLPWLPGRAFSVKGAIAGIAVSVVAAAAWWPGSASAGGLLEIGGLAMASVALAAFLAMNFTGASTFTSLSGVKKEMRVAVPLEIAGTAAGLMAWTASRFVA